MRRALSINKTDIPRIIAFAAAFAVVSLPVLLFNRYGWYPQTHLFKWAAAFSVIAYGAGSCALMFTAGRGEAGLARTDAAWLALLLSLALLQAAFVPVRNFPEWVRNWYFFAALGGAVFLLRSLPIDDVLPAILRSSAVTGGISVIIGFIQRTDPAAARPFIFDISMAQDRFAANTGMDNILGVYLALAILAGCLPLIGTIKLFAGGQKERAAECRPYGYMMIIFDVSLLALNAAGMWMTGSRSAILSCAVGILVLILALRPGARQIKRMAVCAVIASAVVICAAYAAPDTLKVQRRNMRDSLSLNSLSALKEGRYAIWGISLEVIKTAPMFGVGLGNYKWNYMDAMAAFREKSGIPPRYTYWAHSEYLQLIAEIGAAGAAAFFLLLFWYIRLAARELTGGSENERAAERRPCIAWALAAIAVLAVDSCFSRPFHSADTAFTLSLALALISRLCERPLALGRFARFAAGGAIFLIASSGMLLFADSFSDQAYIGKYFYNPFYITFSSSAEREKNKHPLLLRDAYLRLAAKENYVRARITFGGDAQNDENYRDAVRTLTEYFMTEPRYDELNKLMTLYQARGEVSEGEKYFKYYPEDERAKFLRGEFDGRYMQEDE
ncbi:hypothetical protein FACS1894216_19450 [Synergistales bacterium]|nr:hypothetical protein FACS1894216_19450 [Synergistales bacterium]